MAKSIPAEGSLGKAACWLGGSLGIDIKRRPKEKGSFAHCDERRRALPLDPTTLERVDGTFGVASLRYVLTRMTHFRRVIFMRRACSPAIPVLTTRDFL